MIGWRARLGFLVPPGNPTIEPEMTALAPQGVSVHFHRMTARGVGGSLAGQDERNRMMVDNLDASIELLAMVKPDVIVVAHTATSYYLRREREADLLAKLEAVQVPAGPINSLDQVFADPQVVHRGMRIDPPSNAAKAGRIPGVRTPIIRDGVPMAVPRPSPLLGEHTAEILREIGEG